MLLSYSSATPQLLLSNSSGTPDSSAIPQQLRTPRQLLKASSETYRQLLGKFTCRCSEGYPLPTQDTSACRGYDLVAIATSTHEISTPWTRDASKQPARINTSPIPFFCVQSRYRALPSRSWSSLSWSGISLAFRVLSPWTAFRWLVIFKSAIRSVVSSSENKNK